MKSHFRCSIGMGAPIWDDDEVDAFDCDVHGIDATCFSVLSVCFRPRAFVRCDPEQNRNVPFNTPADDDPRFCSIIHHAINFDLDSVSVVPIAKHYNQSRTRYWRYSHLLLLGSLQLRHEDRCLRDTNLWRLILPARSLSWSQRIVLRRPFLFIQCIRTPGKSSNSSSRFCSKFFRAKVFKVLCFVRGDTSSGKTSGTASCSTWGSPAGRVFLLHQCATAPHTLSWLTENIVSIKTFAAWGSAL